MKQSVDLMNSMKRFSFRHSNSGTYSTRRTYSTAPTSLARRALLPIDRTPDERWECVGTDV